MPQKTLKKILLFAGRLVTLPVLQCLGRTMSPTKCTAHKTSGKGFSITVVLTDNVNNISATDLVEYTAVNSYKYVRAYKYCKV